MPSTSAFISTTCVLDARQRQVAPVLDGAGGVHHGVDRVGRHDDAVVIGHDREAGGDRRVGPRPPLLTRRAPLTPASAYARSALSDGAVDDRGHLHAGSGVHDLVDQTPTQEPGADRDHPDRATCCRRSSAVSTRIMS